MTQEGVVTQYTYDATGSITQISEDGVVKRSYTYDAMNQLTSETRNGVTETYTYDSGGNILSRTRGGVTDTWSYGSTLWKDLLTSYNGQAITYDEIGNPLSYRDGMTMTCMTGGIVGYIYTSGYDMTGTLRNCYNEGTVSSGKNAGGVVGYVQAVNQGTLLVENCYSSVMASGVSLQGAVVATKSASGTGSATIQNCYYITGSDSYADQKENINAVYEALTNASGRIWILDANGVPILYWELTEATVTFETDYGTAPASMTVTVGEAITLPELEDDGDYVFVGWWTFDSGYAEFYSAGEEYEVTWDVTFLAEWDEIITVTAPFTTTVELGDSGVPGETVFELEVVAVGLPIDESSYEGRYEDVTVSASVTTNGEGDYDATMAFTGPSRQLWYMLVQGGAFVRQVDAGEEGWTYDDSVWYLYLHTDPEISMLASTDNVEPEYDGTESGYEMRIYRATCEETEEGSVYNLDWENVDWSVPEAKMVFTNTYTAHGYTLKHNESEHWNECGCGDVQNKEAHQYGEWTVTKEATETETGEKEHTCTVCGYTQTAEIEKLPAAETNPDTGTGTDTQSPQTGDNNNIVLWFSLMLVAGAALTGTAVYTHKKKRSR